MEPGYKGSSDSIPFPGRHLWADHHGHQVRALLSQTVHQKVRALCLRSTIPVWLYRLLFNPSSCIFLISPQILGCTQRWMTSTVWMAIDLKYARAPIWLRLSKIRLYQARALQSSAWNLPNCWFIHYIDREASIIILMKCQMNLNAHVLAYGLSAHFMALFPLWSARAQESGLKDVC